jgi:hypothetical protein
MLIVRLKGGLGNQMFQYALAKSLALAGKEVFLDASFSHYSTETKRAFSLGCFNTDPQLQILRSSQLPWVFRNPPGDILKKVAIKLRLMGFAGNWSYFLERQSCFHPEVFDLKEPAYLDGFWQTDRYCRQYWAAIVHDFTLRDSFSGFSDCLENIRKVNAISLHIRRGDYLTNPTSKAVHNVCAIEYYRAAYQFMVERVHDPVFFAFSDEPDWVKANFGFLGKSFKIISDRKIRDYEELILMSYCQHHIIANSSFSWWGAMLNHNSGKIVIAPRQWLHGEQPVDLIPDAWIQL